MLAATLFVLLAAAPETGSVTLREDAATGALELLATYPAGHAFKPHTHNQNERIVVLDGSLKLETAGKVREMSRGDYAFIPAKQEHTLTCAATGACRFYVGWSRE